MKINYHTHKALRFFDDKTNIIFPNNDSINLNRALFDDYNTVFKENLNIFRSNMFFISDNFRKSALIAKEKFLELAEELAKSGSFNINGTYMIGDYIHMVNYDFNIVDDILSENTIHYIFKKTGEPEMYFKGFDKKYYLWLSGRVKKKHNIKLPFLGKGSPDFVQDMLNEIAVVELFKRYADIETTTLPANKIIKDFDCKYENSTNRDIKILDSKWFTSLVKSDAFKVRGHFRLQPHKVGGEWTKKLIWINDFEKSGYTAPAQKLNVN